MADNDFTEGRIKYTVDKETPEAIDFSKWSDGYLAFSSIELRLKDDRLNGQNLTKLFGSKSPINGIEGYLMEVDLWKHEDGIYEEIAIEREDRGFLVQRWILYTAAGTEPEGNKSRLCYWRKVDVSPIERKKSRQVIKTGEIAAIEIIVPDRRLHFFMTIPGDRKNGKK